MAGKNDIAFHYDEDVAFFERMLGPTLAYSCANWENASNLDQAQDTKLKKLISFSGAQKDNGSILDIGCGWGSLPLWLKRQGWKNQYFGITISAAQAAYNHAFVDGKTAFILDDCFNALASDQLPRYDHAVSIGAFEHFASPEDYKNSRHLDRYSQFFDLVREKVSGGLGLQTIVVRKKIAPEDRVGTARVLRFLFYISKNIFPNSLLPSASDLLQVAEKHYDIQHYDLHSDNYAKTCAAWLERLENQKDMIRPDLFSKYQKYLKLCIDHFNDEFIGLAQVSLMPKT